MANTMDAEQYCQQQAANSGSSFYYSFMFLEPKQRQAITAVYAFCRAVDDVVDDCTDPTIATTTLNWWRSEIERVFHGNPQHPIGISLKHCLSDIKFEESHFHEIINGMAMDVHPTRYQSFEELTLYCYRVAGVVGLIAAKIFGYNDAQTLEYAKRLGTAFQLTNILRDVGEDAQRGRIYLPLNELQQFNVTEADILNRQPSDALCELLSFQAQRAKQYYQQAYALLPECDRYHQRSGLIMAAIYQSLLEKIIASHYAVLRQRISLNPLKKLWIAWKTNRNEKRLYAQYRRTATAR